MATTTSTENVSSERLRALIQEELADLVDIRHDLHRHPELGYAEHRTSDVVQRELERAGVEFARNLGGGTGVLGHLPGRSESAIGLRADMDALPIVETTGAEYASETPGVMHACGHDGHTTMLLGAARVLGRIAAERELPRPVSFVFQPAEEGGAGAKRMIEDGCLDGSVIGAPIEGMFGLHGWPRYPLGMVGSRPGPLLAAADMFEITIAGSGAHAAFPHLGADPVLAGSALVCALQMIASRNADPLDSIVVSTTQFHGGTTHNVIPSEVRLAGTVRTLQPETQRMAIDRIHEIAQGIASAHGCRADVDYTIHYPVTRNDPGAVEEFLRIANESLGPDRIVEVPTAFMGGEDFSFYCHEVPSCFFVLGLCPPGQDRMPELHQPSFDFNDDAIPTGIEMFCRLALR